MTKEKQSGPDGAASKGSGQDLRQRAKDVFREKAARMPENLEALSPEETRQILHELRVHQIELEMQNEELRVTQKALEASRARYFDLYDLAPVSYFTVSEQGMILEANLTAANLLGVARGVLVKQPLTRFILPKDQDIYYRHRKALFETHSASSGQAGEPQVCELRMTRQGGDPLWARIESTLARYDETGAPLCRAVMSDITERKCTEEALKKSNQLLRDTGEMAQIGGWELDLSTKEVFLTEEVCRIHGVEPGYKPKFEEGLNFYAPESRPEVEAVVKKAAETGKPYDLESLLIPRGSKDQIWVRSLGKAVYSGGKIVKLAGTLQSIDKYKRAEEALRESEELFRTVVESTTDAIVILDMNRIIVSCNQGFCKLFGYTVDEVRGTSVQMLHRSEEAYHRFGEIAYASIEKTGSYRGEVYFTKKDGTVFPGETVTSAIEKSDSVAGYVGIIRDITERKQDEAERELLMAAIGQAGESVFITDPAGIIQYVNPTFERVTGYLREEAVGKNTRILKSGKQDEAFYRDLWETISGGKTWKGRMVNKRKDGKLYTEEATISPVCDASGRILNYVAVKRDITEQLQLAAQFLQAQKLEAVGRLTGGIAHDFNNLLTTIIGNADMAIAEVGKESGLYEHLEDIKGAGERAAKLTRQLLAFSRKQVLQPEVVNLNEVVGEVGKMLRHLIGEDIELETVLAPELGMVEADIGLIEQVIMNLAVNAKDAMPGGGKLTIETANVDLDEQYAKNHVVVTPGPFVMLCVSDTGVGMSPEVQAQVFEPFFTTKEKGKGTGLGLSTVYGIVKQSSGNIWVYSEVGGGTSFKIYLPRVDKSRAGEKGKGVRSEARGGTETVLVVEDEERVRNLAVKILRGNGYRVLATGDGQKAMEISKGHEGPIHLLLTDVVMPGMSGRELGERLEGQRPELKVLFMSGYTDNAIVHHGILDKGIAFIQKPFTPEDLARKVREVLEKKIRWGDAGSGRLGNDGQAVRSSKKL